MKVKDIMTRCLCSIGPTDSIADAAALMGERDVGWLPVVDDGRLVGVVTDRDVAVRGLARGLQAEAPVFRLMTGKVTSCHPGANLAEALHIMASQQVRRLPVCSDDGTLLGMVSLGDALYQPQYCGEAGEALRAVIHPSGPHCQACQPSRLAG